MEIIKLKLGDVYTFSWNSEEYDKQLWQGSLSHCFEGLLVVMNYPIYQESSNSYKDELRLVDTFWGVNSISNNKSFTLEEAQKKGNLSFYCNLFEIEPVKNCDLDKYDDDDIYRLHDQHSCVESCNYYYIKKGAKKSPKKRISVIDAKINTLESDIAYKIREIKFLSAERQKIEISGLKE